MAAVSRGLGVRQRQVLTALHDRRENDLYLPEWRARWRWYTIDLLDLVDDNAPRSERVSLHRAIGALACDKRVSVSTTFPYPTVVRPGVPFADIDLVSELGEVDPRWPRGRGRCLWFRLPSRRGRSARWDQAWAIRWLNGELTGDDDWMPEAVWEFLGTLDRQRAWASEMGRFVAWLFCGHPRTDPIGG